MGEGREAAGPTESEDSADATTSAGPSLLGWPAMAKVDYPQPAVCISVGMCRWGVETDVVKALMQCAAWPRVCQRERPKRQCQPHVRA